MEPSSKGALTLLQEMLESVNSKSLSGRTLSFVEQENESQAKGVDSVQMAFCFASFGYMVIWTGIGSRVTYYNEVYGPSFFVWLNIVFYVTGLPIAVLQKKCDNHVDGQLTTRASIRFRLLVCIIGMAVCAFILPFVDQRAFIGVVSLIGVFTWAIHGTISKAAALVKYNASIYQQVGFALPGVTSIALLLILTLFEREELRNNFFYGTLSLMALLSLVGHAYILNNTHVLTVLDSKDEEYRISGYNQGGGDGCVVHSPVMDAEDNQATERMSLGEGGIEIGEQQVSTLQTNLLLPIGKDVEDSDYAHLLTIFITLFASVLQGSFISFVSSGNDFPVASALYFTRLFADMLGRPLALLHPSPACDTIEFLLGLAILRLLVCLVFFLYVFERGDDEVETDGAFVVMLQIIISLSSGYIVASVYEKAAILSTSQQRNYRILARMNLSFQSACASSSLAAGLVLVAMAHS